MTPIALGRFQAENPDILIEELRPEDLDRMGYGTAVFGVTVANGKKPKSERQVTDAGYMLLVHRHKEEAERPVAFLALTLAGHAKIQNVYPRDIGPDGNYALYRTKPMDASDARDTWNWQLWN